MKIFSIEQIQNADKYTIEHEPISSLLLMERAASIIYLRIKGLVTPSNCIHIFCGCGNNGGDGLVIARLLANDGFYPTVWLTLDTQNPSLENSANYQQIKNNPNITINLFSDFLINCESRDDNCVYIDAIFGSGLNKPLTGIFAEIVQKINEKDGLKIAIDIPSGLFADKINSDKDVIFKSDYTFTIQFPKSSFFYTENAPFVGQWDIVEIGLHPIYINRTQTDSFYILVEDIQQILKSRTTTSHKGIYGHALMITGSYGMMGASVLSSKSCLRSGVGLLTVHVPKCGINILQSTVSEAMVSADNCETHFTSVENKKLDRYHAIGVGCGLAKNPESASGLKGVIYTTHKPMVIDADAINIIAENQTWIPFIPQFSILTPHLKEFERLVGKFDNSEQKIQLGKDFSSKHNLILVLKGANTAIILPSGEVYFNSTGNPGMATAGSGDVLTGIITGLLAQGYSPAESAILGVYIHGLAADLAIDHSQSVESLIASDISEYLGAAFQLIRRKN